MSRQKPVNNKKHPFGAFIWTPGMRFSNPLTIRGTSCEYEE